jgi:hypothetical protein
MERIRWESLNNVHNAKGKKSSSWHLTICPFPKEKGKHYHRSPNAKEATLLAKKEEDALPDAIRLSVYCDRVAFCRVAELMRWKTNSKATRPSGYPLLFYS